MKNKKMLSVLVVEPGKVPYTKEIASSLASLQHEVDGDVQAIYPYREAVAILCDEEAKLKGKTLNRALRDEDGKIYDLLAGTFLIVGLGDGAFASLSAEHIQQFEKKFHTPELFMRINGKIAVLPAKQEINEP